MEIQGYLELVRVSCTTLGAEVANLPEFHGILVPSISNAAVSGASLGPVSCIRPPTSFDDANSPNKDVQATS